MTIAKIVVDNDDSDEHVTTFGSAKPNHGGQARFSGRGPSSREVGGPVGGQLAEWVGVSHSPASVRLATGNQFPRSGTASCCASECSQRLPPAPIPVERTPGWSWATPSTHSLVESYTPQMLPS